MKFRNIFKKESKIEAKAKIQLLDKKQLERVAGGAETRGDGKPVKALDPNPSI